MSQVFVIPDLHGNWRLALGLLQQEGLVEHNDDGEIRRLDTESYLVQLGDGANCVRESINDDLNTIRFIGRIFDRMLIGNHEHPYFGGPSFDGFAFFAELKEALWKLNDRGFIQPAFEVDGILLTHAGMTIDVDQIDKWHGGSDNKAKEMANGLNTLWRNKEYRHGMFSAIGRARGGPHPRGGVLWSDWSEPKATVFPQIFGHTVGKTWRVGGTVIDTPTFPLIRPYPGATPMEVQTLCIDIGAGMKSRKILGCWIRNGEVELVQHEALET